MNVYWLKVHLASVGNYYYGADHPMKPFRIKMAHQLVLNYGIYKYLDIYVSFPPIPRNHTMLQMQRCSNFIVRNM